MGWEAGAEGISCRRGEGTGSSPLSTTAIFRQTETDGGWPYRWLNRPTENESPPARRRRLGDGARDKIQIESAGLLIAQVRINSNDGPMNIKNLLFCQKP